MHGTKRVALVAGVVGLAALWFALRTTSGPRGPALEPEGVGVAEPRPVSELSAGERSEASSPRTAPAVDRAADRADGPRASETPAPEAPWRFEVGGRVVDARGTAVAGAELRTRARTLATTAADGVLRAQVELVRDSEEVYQGFSFDGGVPATTLLVTARGYRTEALETRIVQGGVTHLGTIVLAPGGDVAGLVLDEAGSPFAGATVDWLGAEQFPSEEAAQGWLREYGPQWDGLRPPAAVTRSDGRFELTGLPLADVFLVAGASGHDFVWSEPFPVTPGEVPARTLVLGPRRTTPVRIEGRVVDSGGAPLAGCDVRVDDVGVQGEGLESIGYGGGPYVYYGTLAEVRTDGAGGFAAEFETREPASVRVSLLARDAELRGYPTTLEDVAPATGPFEIVLAAPRRLALRLVDSLGEAAAGSRVAFSGADSDLALVRELQSLGEDGFAEFLRPLEPFRVEVHCPGFRSETHGPFDPATLGPELRLVLQRGQAVHGRVTAGGRGLAGVRLGLHLVPAASVQRSTSLAPLDRPFTARGALALGRLDATTDGEGRFILTLQADGMHVITAEADGHPWTAFGPFAWQRASGAGGLELELLPAGAIEGRVLVPPGRSSEGRLVGAASGWNVAFTTSAGADGRYRIEGLAPGRYEVRPCVPPAASRESFGVRGEEGRELAFDCQVFPGQVTVHDLDLRDEEDFVLRGSFRFDGEAPWNVTVVSSSEGKGQKTRLGETLTSSDGVFEFRLSKGGPLLLEIVRGEMGFAMPLLLESGVTEWHAAPSAGSILLRAVPESSRERPLLWFTLEWRDPSGLEATRSEYCWGAESRTELGPLVVPAGRVDLWGHGTRKEKALLGQFDVRAGEETQFVVGAR